jgi:hypothetical protein
MLANAHANQVQYMEYPSNIGSEIMHWVSFKGFDFKSNNPTLDVALYIPGDALNTSYKSDYESVGLGSVLGKGSADLKAASKDGFNLEGFKTAMGSTMSGVRSEGKQVALIEAAKLGSGLAAGAKTAMEQKLGAVLNPYIVAAYKGPSDMRTHDFTFQMLPQSKQESRACVKIAAAFKSAMLPSHSGANSADAPGMLFGYPDQFEVSFFVNGDEMPKTSSNPMFSIGRSVLTACDLDYATESTALFFDDTQYPVSISMKLSFMELEVMHRGKIQLGF